jgi:ubiquinone/menaquinone biosynthesis C-methylase UbiE
MGFECVKEVIFTKNGAKNKYNLTSESYHLIMGVFEITPNLEALELVNIKKGEKVLDLAFGTGWVLEKIIPKTGSKEKVYGIDFAEEMHKVTIERLKKKKIDDRVILTEANVLAMPYKDNTFDVIFASFILDLQKITDIPILLEEIKRVLKTNGRAVIVAMTKEGKGLKKIARCFYDWFYDYWPTILGYRASSRPIYVNEELERAGFKIIQEKLTRVKFLPIPVKIALVKKP